MTDISSRVIDGNQSNVLWLYRKLMGPGHEFRNRIDNSLTGRKLENNETIWNFRIFMGKPTTSDDS
jgi:hypothetical protein